MLKMELSEVEVARIRLALDTLEGVIMRKSRAEFDPAIARMHQDNALAIADLGRKFVVKQS